jgi:inorganic pyrophosphatase
VDDDIIRVVVESPRGSTVKLKYDMTLQVMTISRPLSLGLTFPYDWGFVPGTRAADGDPLDAIVLWDVATYPGVVIPCRALALLKVEQNGEKTRIRNDRLILRPVEARREANRHDGAAMTERVRNELAQFLIAMTVLEGKEIEILGWDGPGAAIALIRSSGA